jgi:hypothetical protein
MTSLLSDMRTVRPQGRTFRITQPHGLRASYLGMHSGLYNRSNRIVTDIALVKDRRKTIDTAAALRRRCEQRQEEAEQRNHRRYRLGDWVTQSIRMSFSVHTVGHL